MIWYLVLGYLAACYVWGMYILARLYLGRRLRVVLTGGGRASQPVPQLRLTDAPPRRLRIPAEMPQSEAA